MSLPESDSASAGQARQSVALTALKSAGGAVADAGSAATRAFRRVDRDGDGVPDDPAALATLRELRSAAASKRNRSKRTSKSRGKPLDEAALKSRVDELTLAYRAGEIDSETYVRRLSGLTPASGN